MQSSVRRSHDRLVADTVEALRSQGATSLKADHLPNYSQPDQIGGFIPDVTANAGSTFVICEAESREMLSEQHTLNQWRTFWAYANRVGGVFVAVVNVADEAAAGTLLRQVCGNAANVRLWTF